jgi:hypothetical protein
MAKTEMKHVTCDNCGATVEFQVTLTGIGELDDYLKRGWAVIALPQEIAEQFEGRVITRLDSGLLGRLLVRTLPRVDPGL